MDSASEKLQSFDCEEIPITPETLLGPRPVDRPRGVDASPSSPPSLQFFDCELLEVAPGTPAAPRPEGKERPVIAGSGEK